MCGTVSFLAFDGELTAQCGVKPERSQESEDRGCI